MPCETASGELFVANPALLGYIVAAVLGLSLAMKKDGQHPVAVQVQFGERRVLKSVWKRCANR